MSSFRKEEDREWTMMLSGQIKGRALCCDNEKEDGDYVLSLKATLSQVATVSTGFNIFKLF